jgi:hypothetical protein
VKVLAAQHPEWKTKEPFASLLRGNVKGVLAGGEKAIVPIVIETHTGMTADEFNRIVIEWIATAKHPVTERLYTEMVYQPMLELVAYLRERLQDVHCLWRWHRFHAALDRKGLWHPTSKRRWQQRQGQVRTARWKAGAATPARNRLHQ